MQLRLRKDLGPATRNENGISSPRFPMGLARRSLDRLPTNLRDPLTHIGRVAVIACRLARHHVTTRALFAMLRSSANAYPRTCPVCGYRGIFDLTTYGTPPRWDCECPRCQSNERRRLMALAFASLPIDRSAKILHFAPEKPLADRLRPSYPQYRTAQLQPGRADLTLNIEDIALDSDSIDVVLCSHVLEHVDDAKAIPELFRILRPAGRLLIMVPIIEGWEATYENPAIVNSEERRLHFGRVDHLRWYGADLRHRLRSAGFELTEFTAGGKEAVEYGLLRGEKVFICRKPTRLKIVPQELPRPR
jgi:SAM-dependent methyltransferase